MHICEGEEWDVERPTIFQQAFTLLKENCSLQELSESMHIYTSEIKDIVSNIVTADILEALSRQNPVEDNIPANIVWLKSNAN